MTKVDSILKNTRQELGYELSEVAKKTKLPLKYLKAFEEADSHHYPNEPYCSLLIKDYADFLGLNGQEIVRLFRRDFIENSKPKSTIISSKGLTPKYVFFLIMTLVVALFITYLFNEYLRFTAAPKLDVNWPKIITKETIEINGRTTTDATVRVNQDLVIVNTDGTFSKKIISSSPSIRVVIESKSPAGKSTIVEKTLNFQDQ